MARVSAILSSWRRHPWLAAGLFALLLLLCYPAGRYYWASSKLRDARLAMDRGDWAVARQHLEASLNAWPNDPTAHLLSARALRRLERYEQAEKHLAACEQLLGKHDPAVELERDLLRLYQGDLDKVEARLRTRVAQDDPDAVEILDVLSAALIINYRVTDAERCLDELLRRQPDHFHALARRAWTARSNGHYGKAVEYFKKALALRPDVDAVRLPLAEIQVALGHFVDAQQHFEELSKRQPNHPSVRFGLARCLKGTNRLDEARQVFDRLLADYPADWQALSERGHLLLQLERPADAESDLRRALSLGPPDLPVLTRLVSCLRLQGKQEEAGEFQAQADQLLADFKHAGQLGNIIREQRPDDAALRHELGTILLRLRKHEDALHWFQTALEKDPRHRPTYEALVDFYEKMGNPTEASRYRQVLRSLGEAK